MFFVDEKDIDFDVNTAENGNNGDATENDFFCFHFYIFEHDKWHHQVIFFKVKSCGSIRICINMYRFIGFFATVLVFY